MESSVTVSDHAIWFKHLPNRTLQNRLADLEPEAEITLEVDGVTGRWRRMKRGVDGRLPDAIIPIGPMKVIWNDWFRNRRSAVIPLKIVTTADDYLSAQTVLLSEWASPEDDAAFNDL